MTTEFMLDRELDRVLSALTPTNRLVCEVMLQTGLRVGDVLSLRTEGLKPVMWVHESKTGKKRQVGFTNALYNRMMAQAGKVYVFESRLDPEKPRSRQTVWADVDRAARAFRLPQNIGTHSMRKIYAVHLMEKYGDIERVKRALKHSSVHVTVLYAAADKLLEAKRKRKAAEQRRRARG